MNKDKFRNEINNNQDFFVMILIGKSASGKDTIQAELVNNYGYSPIVSTTSRPIRDGEIDGVNYHYVSKDVFKERIRDGKFIEFRSYDTLVNGKPDTWYYGVEKMNLTGKNVAVLDIDGAKSLIEYYGKNHCDVVYIEALDEVRKERAIKRGSFDEIEWNRRAIADEKDFNAERVFSIADSTVSNNQGVIKDVIENILSTNKCISLTKNFEREVNVMENTTPSVADAYGRAIREAASREKNGITVYRDGNEYVVRGNFKGTFADLCATIEKQTGSPIEFGDLTENKDDLDLNIDVEEEER